MKPLTRRQQDILVFIQEYKALKGFPPTRSEIANWFSWSSANSAECHLRALANKGAIFIERGKSRGIRIA